MEKMILREWDSPKIKDLKNRYNLMIDSLKPELTSVWDRFNESQKRHLLASYKHLIELEKDKGGSYS